MPSSTAVFAAFLSTGFISLAPNAILFLFPRFASRDGLESPFLSCGQLLAAGGLLGDTFLHALPHAISDNMIGVYVLVGFTVFFALDIIIRSLGGGHDHHSQGHHEHVETKNRHQHFNRSAIALNLAADAMHNFTDGLAIGASYAMSIHKADETVASHIASRGGLATLSILFHEVPHEIGDFCTLIRAGYSKNQAVRAQFSTASAAFVGTGVALFFADEVWMGERLILITSGGFVYLAATTIIPYVLEAPASIKLRLAQLASFIAGVAILYLVAVLEETEDVHGDHYSHMHLHSHAHGNHGQPSGHHLQTEEHHHHDHVHYHQDEL